ncbi:MAG: oxaloacetate decarboxylase subunit alpha [Gammaproteobacteria bacterium]|nr:MAG: oxaloacetate decarboxylase subunit alpha [Gammaproteobacteria bacterium]
MSEQSKPLGITELVLRDAHQSLFATRLRIDDMLPIAEKLDQVGYWSLETWGGATFDACIRYLGEDPWDRLRQLKQAMPNTPQQMLFRGQNILGYRHYADDVVEKFVERAAINGIDVFRVFDAMNDLRNLTTAIRAVKQQGKHAQGTISYTVSPVHTIDHWVDMGRAIEDMDADSICIKDMAGLLKPYVGLQLVSRLKQSCDIPIHLHCHATTGLSTATIVKCVEAGVDNVDTAISSMSMTYGHSPTESIVEIFNGTLRQTGIDIHQVEEIAAYFRGVRKKYSSFEGSLRGVDSRILLAQVPGGMLTNMESQLREQGAEDRFDEVLQEIPRVREDLGFIPLVTPTSQIVGSQAVINVLSGERYKTITKETCGVLKGEYGASPAAVNSSLQKRVLQGEEPITCRPADLLSPELDSLTDELLAIAEEDEITISDGEGRVEDVLVYALFPQAGLRFLQNRGNPEAFEPPVSESSQSQVSTEGEATYTVTLEGISYTVVVAEGGDISGIVPVGQTEASPGNGHASGAGVADPVKAPLAGAIIRVLVTPEQQVVSGEPLLVLEAMKMETTVSAARDGVVAEVMVKAGDSVSVGDCLMTLA